MESVLVRGVRSSSRENVLRDYRRAASVMVRRCLSRARPGLLCKFWRKPLITSEWEVARKEGRKEYTRDKATGETLRTRAERKSFVNLTKD